VAWYDAGSVVITTRWDFCVNALPVDICTVSDVGSMFIISVENA
jgi:hypothetical protein